MTHTLDCPFQLLADGFPSTSKRDPRPDNVQEKETGSLFTACDREFLKDCFSAMSIEIDKKLSPVQQQLVTLEGEFKQLRSRLGNLELHQQNRADPTIQRRTDEIEDGLRTSLTPLPHKDDVSKASLQELGKQLQSRIDNFKLSPELGIEQAIQHRKDENQAASRTSAIAPPGNFGNVSDSNSQRKVLCGSTNKGEKLASLLVGESKSCLQKSNTLLVELAHNYESDSGMHCGTDETKAALQNLDAPAGCFAGLQDPHSQCRATQQNMRGDETLGPLLASDSCLRQLRKQLESQIVALEPAHELGMNLSVFEPIGSSGSDHGAKAQCQAECRSTGKDESRAPLLVVESKSHLQQVEHQLGSKTDDLELTHQNGTDQISRTSADPPPGNFGGLQEARSQLQAQKDETLAPLFVDESKSCLQKLRKQLETQVIKVDLAHQLGLNPPTQRNTDGKQTESRAERWQPAHLFSLPTQCRTDRTESALRTSVAPPPGFFFGPHDSDERPALDGMSIPNVKVNKPDPIEDVCFDEPKASYAMGRNKKKVTYGKGGPMTMIICNIPCRVTHVEVVEAINSVGFAGTFENVHLPSRQSHSNLGYGFVKFFGQADAKRFALAFEGYCFSQRESTKACIVKVADRQRISKREY